MYLVVSTPLNDINGVFGLYFMLLNKLRDGIMFACGLSELRAI